MNRLFFASIVISFLTLICGGTAFSQYQGPRDDPIVIQIIELDHANAEDLARVLTPFLSKDGRITAYGPTNSLIIKDRKSIVRELVKVIKGKMENDE
jgi:type II secretory pathway component GspD/PulD (secretin)